VFRGHGSKARKARKAGKVTRSSKDAGPNGHCSLSPSRGRGKVRGWGKVKGKILKILG
jgi:hypothetical protein